MSVLTCEEQRTVDAAQAFVATHVLPLVEVGALGPAQTRNLHLDAARAGLLGLEVAVDQGGQGLSFACKWRVAEVLAAADFGLAMALINSHNVAHHLARVATPELAQQVVPALLSGQRTGCIALTEPTAGSDFSAITTLARRVGDEWQIDGHKTWIVNAQHAEAMVVYAQTEAGSGARGIAAFYVDGTRAGFVRDSAAAGNTENKAARSMGSGGFQLLGYRARAHELLHPPGQAFKAALSSINGARVYVAAMCCGMVAECLRVAADYGATRHTFGKPLHDHQGWRWVLADAAIDLAAARLLVDAAATHIGAGVDAQTSAARAKVFTTRMAGRHIAALLHAMGAEGLREQHPFLRHLAAAQVATLTDGSTEMLLERVAKDLRHPPLRV